MSGSIERPSAAFDPTDLRDRRITVVGIHYAPETTGNAPYTTGLCQFLVEAGAEVTMVTGLPHYPEWQVAQGYGESAVATETLDGVRVIRARHYVPTKQSAATRARFEASFLINGRRAARMARAADAVIAVTPTLSAAVVGAELARRVHAPLGIVVQDLVGSAAQQSGIEGGARVAGLAGALEKRVLDRADRIAVIAPGFADALAADGIDKSKVQWLRNYSHVTASAHSREQARIALGWPVEGFLAVHTGNMGLKQDLGNLLDAARSLKDRDDITFVMVGDGNQRQMLQTMAADLPRVLFVDPLPAALYPDALAAADVLLLNERDGMKDMSLPSKLTSYFVAGRPVVAAVTPGGETARELERSGGAIVVPAGQPQVLAATLTRIADGEIDTDALALQGATYAANELSIGAARRGWLGFVADVLNTPNRRRHS